MPRCVIFGFYDGHGAIVCIDSSFPQSSLSAHFADQHNLSLDTNVTYIATGARQAYSSCFALFRLPSVGGVYASRMRIPVTSLPKYDLLIGSDWIAATRATVTSRGLEQPSKRDRLSLRFALRRGLSHSWEPNSTKGGARTLVGEVYGPLQLSSSIQQRTTSLPQIAQDLRRRPVEVPFDITHHIVDLLKYNLDPHSYELEVRMRTLKSLCLVSRMFNAAANAVLYSSIAVSEFTLLSLLNTSRMNAPLLHHCHSLWFKFPISSWAIVTWASVAQIVSCCPNLRRVVWLHEPNFMTMSLFSAHLSQLTDLAVPHTPFVLLKIGLTHTFPCLQRFVVAEAHFDDDDVVRVLLRMPQLTDLVTDPPPTSANDDTARVEAHAQGIAAVVTHTALQRIIWAHIASTADPDMTTVSELEKHVPICARTHDILSAAACNLGPRVTFEFVSWSVSKVRSRILDGKIWNRSDTLRARISP